jgi:HD-GYP domain-containing protein (c-di-GMP phosphodiesterase class II)
MKSSNEEYFTRSVTELADIVPVTTSQEVYSTTGIKLVNKNVRLDSSFFEKLARHSILPPLEQCLVVENGVNNGEIVLLAKRLLELNPALVRLVKNLPDHAGLFEALQGINLSRPMVFLLTLARERRPVLFAHSVTVALICIYLGIKLNLPMKQLIDLASAGLFHDLGELRIDSRLLKEDAHPTPNEREEIFTHPATSQRMLLNSSIYSLEIIKAVMSHHEYIDGSGFPFGLMGVEMGKLSKILSIAEVAATKLDQEAGDGIARLEVALKFNLNKFDPVLLGYLSPLYEHRTEQGESANTQTNVSEPQLHNQINNIVMAIVYWQRLLGSTPIRARSPSAYIHQRLASLSQATREAGINTSNQTSVTDAIGGDAKCMVELDQINKETLRQIMEVVFEVQRRWPTYQSDMTDVGKVVSSWMEHMQGLLLEEREIKK